jgi:MerR family transcriptional regulator, light-induced transcriptional regulator
MTTYSIKELGLISGIMPHTIRIWEQRYDLLKPFRTNSNIRYYNDEQLRKLLNVCELLNAGMKISQISGLSQIQLATEIDKIISASFKSEDQFATIVNQLVIASATFDEGLFEKVFSNSVLRFGLTVTYLNVIYPVLVKVGMMWGKNDILPAQEHFLSNLIKQKLFSVIDSLPFPKNTDQTWILFLNEQEEHEIGLLFANYILRKNGRKVFYLGSKVPYENLSNTVLSTKATHLYTFFVKNQPPGIIHSLISRLCKDFGKTKVFVSGKEELLKNLKVNKRLEWIRDVNALQSIAQY